MVKSLDSLDYYGLVINHDNLQAGKSFLDSVAGTLKRSPDEEISGMGDILAKSLQEDVFIEINALLGFILSSNDELSLAPDAVSVIVRHQLVGHMGPMMWSWRRLEESPLKQEFKKHLRKIFLLIDKERVAWLEKQE